MVRRWNVCVWYVCSHVCLNVLTCTCTYRGQRSVPAFSLYFSQPFYFISWHHLPTMPPTNNLTYKNPHLPLHFPSFGPDPKLWTASINTLQFMAALMNVNVKHVLSRWEGNGTFRAWTEWRTGWHEAAWLTSPRIQCDGDNLQCSGAWQDSSHWQQLIVYFLARTDDIVPNTGNEC